MRKRLRRHLARLPKFLRGPLIRKLVALPPRKLNGIEFRLPHHQGELKAAFNLLHEAYVKAGFMRPHDSGMRLGDHQKLATTHILVGVDTQSNKVIATVSIIGDSHLKFPMDHQFDLDQLRQAGKIAEISALAIDPNYRGSKTGVLFHLLNYMYNYCRFELLLEKIIICVNPKHFMFYEAILGFEEIGRRDNYKYANNQPGIAAYLDFATAQQFFWRHYKHRARRFNLYQFFSDGINNAAYLFPHRQTKAITFCSPRRWHQAAEDQSREELWTA